MTKRKIKYTMKKILLVFAVLMTMVFSASAQSDDFFRGGSYDGGSRDISSAMPGLPQGSVGSSNNDQSAPVGSGLLILSALGGAYLLRKSQN